MQDKQGDLKLVMDGPDWPKEDWPLTSADAKNVGEAETMMQSMIQELNAKLAPLGGLGRAHESDDVSVLEEMAALNEVMSGYCELIERHVSTVKRTQRSKKKQAGASSRRSARGAAGSTSAALAPEALR